MKNIPFDWTSSILCQNENIAGISFELNNKLKVEIQDLGAELNECYFLHDILWHIRKHREKRISGDHEDTVEYKNGTTEDDLAKLCRDLDDHYKVESRARDEENAIATLNSAIQRISKEKKKKDALRLIERPAEIILRRRHCKWILSAMHATAQIIKEKRNDNPALALPTMFSEALLRSSLSARAWPGLSMAVVPIAIIAYTTLTIFCRQHRVDRAQLSRVQHGMASFSLPRLQEIIDSIEWDPEEMHINKDVRTPLRPVFLRLAYLPFSEFRKRRSRPILRVPVPVYREMLQPSPKKEPPPMDLDQFSPWLLQKFYKDPEEFKRKVKHFPFHRTYLARVWRNQVSGSIDLFVWMADVLAEPGRISIEGIRTAGAAEPEKELRARVDKISSSNVLAGSSKKAKSEIFSSFPTNEGKVKLGQKIIGPVREVSR